MSRPSVLVEWRLRRGDDGLRMARKRSFGTKRFTWADLLRAPMTATQVYALYFPSRFELPVDDTVRTALRTFGRNTSEKTSVDFWDPTDEHFGDALALFGLRQPPALVLMTGWQGEELADGLYSISFTDTAVLADPVAVAAAVNMAHEILMRCDRKEITGYLRNRKMSAILRAIGRGTGVVTAEFVKLGPVVGLPDILPALLT